MERICRGGEIMIAKKLSYEKLNIEDFTPKKILFKLSNIEIPTKKLKEIAEINPANRKFNKNESNRESYRFVEISAINYITNEIQPKIVTKDQLTPRARFIGKKGDLIIPLIQSNGFRGVLLQEDDLIISDNFALVTSDHNEYIAAIMAEDFVKEQANAYATGSLIERLSLKDLKEIQLPWKSQENRISIVSSYKDTMLTLKNKGENEINYSRSKVDEVFYKFFNIDRSEDKSIVKKISYDNLSKQDWNLTEMISTLEEQLDKLKDAKVTALGCWCDTAMGLNIAKFKSLDGSTSVIKGINIEAFKIVGEIKQENFDEAKATKNGYGKTKEDDILIRVKGKVGDSAIVTKKEVGLLYNDTVIRIRVLNKTDLLPEYLVAYLNSYIAQEQISSFIKGSTASFVSLSQINDKLKIIIPSIDIQKEILENIK